jgi:hypothetical protein
VNELRQELAVVGQALVTLQGHGLAGLQQRGEAMTADGEVVRPAALRGQVPKIDPVTGLAASAAVVLRGQIRKRLGVEVPDERIGIILGSRYGNHGMAKQYGDRIRKGSASPATFSTSGYNVCAGLAAMAARVNGPTMVLAGAHMTWADAVAVAAGFLQRGDADVIMVGQVEVAPDGAHGLCSLTGLALDACRDAQGSQLASLVLDVPNGTEFSENKQEASALLRYMEETGILPLPESLLHLQDALAAYVFYEGDVSGERLSLRGTFVPQVHLQRGGRS